MSKGILITGAAGLVGTDLSSFLKSRYPDSKIVETDIQTTDPQIIKSDVRDYTSLENIIADNHIDTVYHLAGLLSVGGEKQPDLAWQVNLGGLKNILDLASKYKLRVFWPSSIAAFGPTTPKTKTPQHTILEPTTIYGVTKVAGELLCQYYFQKYGVDVRSLRYPGLIAWKAPPGDGTTEYSVHIFYAALKEKKYTCFLKPDTFLPMMYIDDAIAGTVQLMSAPPEKISIRTSYNFSALSFSPAQLTVAIQKLLPDFTCTYLPDHRQVIAESWPKSIDDTIARNDWGWNPQTDLSKLVRIMLTSLKSKI